MWEGLSIHCYCALPSASGICSLDRLAVSPVPCILCGPCKIWSLWPKFDKIQWHFDHPLCANCVGSIVEDRTWLSFGLLWRIAHDFSFGIEAGKCKCAVRQNTDCTMSLSNFLAEDIIHGHKVYYELCYINFNFRRDHSTFELPSSKNRRTQRSLRNAYSVSRWLYHVFLSVHVVCIEENWSFPWCIHEGRRRTLHAMLWVFRCRLLVSLLMVLPGL